MSQKEKDKRDFNLRNQNRRGTKENELDPVTVECGDTGVAAAEYTMYTSQSVTSTAPREPGQRHLSGGSTTSGRSRSTSPTVRADSSNATAH